MNKGFKLYAIKIKKEFHFLYQIDSGGVYVLNWEKLCQTLNVPFYNTENWIRNVSHLHLYPPIQYGLEYSKLPQILKILNCDDSVIAKCQMVRPVLVIPADEERIRLEAERKILNLLERIK
jgi:hypothetical protein